MSGVWAHGGVMSGVWAHGLVMSVYVPMVE